MDNEIILPEKTYEQHLKELDNPIALIQHRNLIQHEMDLSDIIMVMLQEPLNDTVRDSYLKAYFHVFDTADMLTKARILAENDDDGKQLITDWQTHNVQLPQRQALINDVLEGQTVKVVKDHIAEGVRLTKLINDRIIEITQQANEKLVV